MSRSVSKFPKICKSVARLCDDWRTSKWMPCGFVPFSSWHDSTPVVVLFLSFYRSPIPYRVLAAACHRERKRERERESRFRKLEACTLQVFELCHWRQHSHKVDGCPSPEVFSCQQACSARRRWIQMLSASQTGSFVLVFVKPLVPPHQKNTTITALFVEQDGQLPV